MSEMDVVAMKVAEKLGISAQEAYPIAVTLVRENATKNLIYFICCVFFTLLFVILTRKIWKTDTKEWDADSESGLFIGFVICIIGTVSFICASAACMIDYTSPVSYVLNNLRYLLQT